MRAIQPALAIKAGIHASARLILLIVALGLFIACASTGETAGGLELPVASAPALTTPRTTVPPSAAPAKDTPLPIPEIALTPAFPGLDRSTTGGRPVMLRPIPGPLPGESGRFVLIDQAGVIYAIFGGADPRPPELFLNIADRVRTNGREEGLLGMAFDPDYESNRQFYAYYSASSPRRTVLSRFRHSSAGPEETGSSEQVLLEIEQPFPNHTGEMIEFGPDGLLYVGLGDGGSGGDPTGNGQNRSTLLGSLLRIDAPATQPLTAYLEITRSPASRTPGARSGRTDSGTRGDFLSILPPETSGWQMSASNCSKRST